MPEPLPTSLNEARDRTVEVLSASFAQDHLSLDELEKRLERVYHATTIAELDELTADLRGTGTPAAAVVPASNSVPAAALDYERVVAIMAESKRQGLWAVPQRLDIVAVMADSTLDFTQSELPAGIIDIHLRSLMAAVKIVLPPGLRIANRLHSFMSSVNSQVDESPADPHAPVIRLSGWAVMTEVKIHVRHREEPRLMEHPPRDAGEPT